MTRPVRKVPPSTPSPSTARNATARPSRGTYPGRAGPGRFHTFTMVNRPACARPVAPQAAMSRPTTTLVVLARRSAWMLPISAVPISGNCRATAFSTACRTDGVPEATVTSAVTRIISSGNTVTKAE